jgi:membrane protein involved in colicin uptake
MSFYSDRYFILGGIFSIGFFLSLVVLLFFSASLRSKLPILYSMNKSTVISVSLSSEPIKETVQSVESSPSDEPVEEKPAKEVAEPKPSKIPPLESKPQEVSDLFADVKIPVASKQTKNKPRDTKELDELVKKVTSSKRQADVFDKVKSLDLAKAGVKVTAASSGPNVDVYNATIQGVVYSNFHPQAGTQGFSAKIRIRLGSDGTLLAYKVLNYSGNSLFNSEVDLLKERLKQVPLPKNPNGEEAVFDILLTAKE